MLAPGLGCVGHHRGSRLAGAEISTRRSQLVTEPRLESHRRSCGAKGARDVPKIFVDCYMDGKSRSTSMIHAHHSAREIKKAFD